MPQPCNVTYCVCIENSLNIGTYNIHTARETAREDGYKYER
jgi:hypothetical protein